MEQKNNMKLIVYLIIICAYCSVNAQNVSKKCKTCGKVLSSCSFRGQHPVSTSNRPSNKVRQNNSHKSKPYVERTETKGANEDYDLKGVFGSSGLALVKLRGKYGFINKEGEEVVPLKYDSIYCNGSFSDIIRYGWADYHILMSVSQNNKWGYINKDGKIVLPIIYDKMETVFYDSKNNRVVKDGKFGTVDHNGNIVIPLLYDILEDSYEKNVIIAKLGGKYGFIDNLNNIIIPFEFDFTSGFNSNCSLAVVGNDEKYGFIDQKGNIRIPMIYEFAHPFYNGLAAVVKNGKVGFINESGDVIIPFKYDVSYTSYTYDNIFKLSRKQLSWNNFAYGGVAIVKSNDKWGLINQKGENVTGFKYDWFSSASTGGYFTARIGKVETYLDKDGNEFNTEKERSDYIQKAKK